MQGKKKKIQTTHRQETIPVDKKIYTLCPTLSNQCF